MTEAVADHIVSLPMYPELTDEQIQMVMDTVKKAVNVKRKEALPHLLGKAELI